MKTTVYCDCGIGHTAYGKTAIEAASKANQLRTQCRENSPNYHASVRQAAHKVRFRIRFTGVETR